MSSILLRSAANDFARGFCWLGLFCLNFGFFCYWRSSNTHKFTLYALNSLMRIEDSKSIAFPFIVLKSLVMFLRLCEIWHNIMLVLILLQIFGNQVLEKRLWSQTFVHKVINLFSGMTEIWWIVNNCSLLLFNRLDVFLKIDLPLHFFCLIVSLVTGFYVFLLFGPEREIFVFETL